MASLAITLAISSVQAAAPEQSWWRRGITAVAGLSSRTPAPAEQAASGEKKRRTNRGKHRPTDKVEMQNYAPAKPWLETRKGKCAVAIAALASIAAGGYFVVPLVGIGGVVSYFNTNSAPLALPVTQTNSTLSKVPSTSDYVPVDLRTCDDPYIMEQYRFGRDSVMNPLNNIRLRHPLLDTFLNLKEYKQKLPTKIKDSIITLSKNTKLFYYMKGVVAANKECSPTLYADWLQQIPTLGENIFNLVQTIWRNNTNFFTSIEKNCNLSSLGEFVDKCIKPLSAEQLATFFIAKHLIKNVYSKKICSTYSNNFCNKLYAGCHRNTILVAAHERYPCSAWWLTR